MMVNVVEFLFFLQGLNPWIIFATHVLVCGALIILLSKTLGLLGLYLYGAVVTIAANIAVLKIVFFPIYEKPIALGTVLFMSLFLCSDLINEFFGKKSAIRLIWVGFLSYFIFFIFMYFILAYSPFETNLDIQKSLMLLFTPAPAIFIASLVAYFSSQYADALIYSMIHQLTGDRYLWVRAFVSSFFAALLDNTVFSILLWCVFMPHPKSIGEIFWTYIVGIFVLRILLSFLNIGFMYLIKQWQWIIFDKGSTEGAKIK